MTACQECVKLIDNMWCRPLISARFSILLTLLSWSVFSSPSACAAEESSREPKSISAASGNKPILSGSTSVRVDASTKNYEAGMRDLELRLYKNAERRLELSWLEFRKTAKHADLELLSRLGLAEVYLGTDRADQAKRMLEPSINEFSRQFGADSVELGRLYYDLAMAAYSGADLFKARSYVEKSLSIREKILADEHHDIGLTFSLLAQIQDAQGLQEDSQDNYKKALKALEKHSGIDRLDYAEALYGLSVVKQKLGDDQESKQLAENALELKGLAVRFDKTPAQKGVVNFLWRDGMYGSRQVPDSIYPLKYLLVDKLRIASTVVRSDKHTAVLISLANCGRTPIRLAVGPVIMEKISPSSGRLFFCDPALLDVALEEQRISDLTWRRAWLCHLQKTRRIPGYLRNGELDPENFLGNNLFGLYGNWDMNLADAPPVVTREQFIFDQKRLPYDVDLMGFMRGSSTDIRPTLIAPGDARTGLVLFLRQRYETAKVTITVGNARIQIPFKAAAGQ